MILETGEWYREKVYNSSTGQEEWKYYYVNNYTAGTGDAELTIYRIDRRGRVLGPRTWTSSADLVEQMTKVSEDYACSVLKISPPAEDS